MLKEDSIKQTIEYNQLLEAGRNIPLIILANIIMGGLSASILWNSIPSSVLISWIVLLTVSIIARIIIYFTYKNSHISTLRKWQNYFILTSFFSGIIWGFTGLLMAIYVGGIFQGFEVFIIGGMAAGSIATNTSIRWNYPAFMYPMLLSLLVYFILQNDVSYYYMAIMVLFFIVILSIFSFKFRNLQYEKFIIIEKLQNTKNRIEGITSSMGEGVLVLDDMGNLEFMNPEAERILGWSFSEIKNLDFHSLMMHDLNKQMQNNSIINVSSKVYNKKYSETECFKRKNGEVFPVKITASPLSSESHIYDGVVIVFQDITERKKKEQRLKELALYDGLTGLNNRASFDKKLTNELDRSNRYERNLSLMILDVDFFKKINDEYGHQAGDKVIKDVANIIKKSIRNNDFPARYGGEEFIVILPETSQSDALDLAERIRKNIENTHIYISKTETIRVTISIGVATSFKGMEINKIIENADKALYKAKNNGRNQVCV